MITNELGSISGDSKRSAFATRSMGLVVDSEGWRARGATAQNWLQRVYRRTSLIWVGAIIADIAFQATRRADMSTAQATLLDRAELGFTLAFDVELVIRFVANLPHWRDFVRSERNLLDLTLAVVTSVIQIPLIKASQAYAWFTIFQIGRFYRVILAIPNMRRLLVRHRAAEVD